MPLFDFKCPVCGVVDEVYVPGIHTEVYCEDCSDMACDADDCDHSFTKPHRVEMQRQKYGGRSVFNVEGYAAHNRYGLDWENNPSDIRARGLT